MDNSDHNKNRCPCGVCKAFRSKRASRAVKEMWSRPWNDPSAMGTKGQDSLLQKFAEQIAQEADSRGVVLTVKQLRRKAELRRDAHLLKIAKKG